jgi:hypothetical protein
MLLLQLHAAAAACMLLQPLVHALLTAGRHCWCLLSQLHAATRRGCRTDELSASELVVTSAFSKMVASTITYPHEVVRSYMHVTGVAAARCFVA